MFSPVHFPAALLKTLVFICLAWPAYAGYQRHDGFYLSMNVGVHGGIIREEQRSFIFANESSNDREFSYRGGGSTLDLKIGGCPSTNLCLSADVISSQLANPRVEKDGEDQGQIDGLGASQNLLGIGVTHYLSPVNIFLSGTLGLGRFRYENLQSGNFITSEPAPGFYFKAGKEWWVSAKWGLGVSGFLYFLNVREEVEDFESSTNGVSLGILFNTTFN